MIHARTVVVTMASALLLMAVTVGVAWANYVAGHTTALAFNVACLIVQAGVVGVTMYLLVRLR